MDEKRGPHVIQVPTTTIVGRTGQIIVCGQERACVAKVATWRDRPELGFTGLKFREETRAVCWHHTGGVGLREQVHKTLTDAGYSCHFLIEPDGAIFQFADTDTYALHANKANRFSIGVEMVNPATKTNKGTVRRELVRETIHGIEQVATTFTAAQVASALALAETLEDAYGLPAAVPMLNSDVYAEVVPDTVMARFRGHIGHYMVDRSPKPPKRDPGLVLMRALAARPLRGRDGAAE